MSSPFASFRRQSVRFSPEMVLVLGSGMGPLVEAVDVVESVAFGECPGLVSTGVHGHRGRLSLASWLGRRLLLCEGRLHYYEGHSWEQVTAPMRLAASLGVRVALLTNAAGGIHPALGPGTLMVLRDHLDLTVTGWWRTPTRRPSPYSPRLIELAQASSEATGQPLLAGVYAMCSGPSYETPAEIRAMRVWGADAVGMSTGREVEAAHAEGLECLAISCITNHAAGLSPGVLSHQEVIEVASGTAGRLTDLLGRVVAGV